MITNIVSWLSGKKTYLVCVLGVVYAFGIWKWHWPNESEVWGGLGFSGAMTLRAAITKLCRQIADDTVRPPFIPVVIFAALAAVGFSVGGCSNMTPEQQAQWSATANAAAQQATNLALDEAAARLRESRRKTTDSAKHESAVADNK